MKHHRKACHRALCQRSGRGNLDAAGVAVLTLTEGLEPEEFTRSRLTRHEVRRQVLGMAGTLDNFNDDIRATLQEIDWAGWAMIALRLQGGTPSENDTLWFAIRALVPATLMWLRYYRERRPDLFEFKL